MIFGNFSEDVGGLPLNGASYADRNPYAENEVVSVYSVDLLIPTRPANSPTVTGFTGGRMR